MYAAVTCAVDSHGSASINDAADVLHGWSVNAGQAVVSQCPATVDSHGATSRFDDGLTVRSSKCVTGLPPRMTALVTECLGRHSTLRLLNLYSYVTTGGLEGTAL